MTSLAAAVSPDRPQGLYMHAGPSIIGGVNLSITLYETGKFAPDSQARIAGLQTQGSMHYERAARSED